MDSVSNHIVTSVTSRRNIFEVIVSILRFVKSGVDTTPQSARTIIRQLINGYEFTKQTLAKWKGQIKSNCDFDKVVVMVGEGKKENQFL